MNRGFAYLKIKMYESLDSRTSKVIWNVPEIELPLGFIPIIINGLKFLLGYLEGIKGQSISLTFEINDGSYHPVDSDLFDYNRVTTRAIIDCFNPGYFEFKLTRIKANIGLGNRHFSVYRRKAQSIISLASFGCRLIV